MIGVFYKVSFGQIPAGSQQGDPNPQKDLQGTSHAVGFIFSWTRKTNLRVKDVGGIPPG